MFEDDVLDNLFDNRRHQDYSRPIEITPGRFFALAEVIKSVDAQTMASLNDFEKEFQVLLDNLEEENRHLGSVCASITNDAVHSTRRKNSFRSLEEQMRDNRDHANAIHGTHFLGVISSILSQIVAGHRAILDLTQELRPGNLLLSKKNLNPANEFASFGEIQQLVAEMQLNSPTINKFINGIVHLQEAPHRLRAMADAILKTMENYYRFLMHRHTVEGVPTFDSPIVTDIAITIYENVDAHGEIADGADPNEVSAYTVNRAMTLANALQDGLVRTMVQDQKNLMDFVEKAMKALWTSILTLQTVYKSKVDAVNSILERRVRDAGHVMDDVQRSVAMMKDVDPRSIVAKDKSIIMSREERFNREFRNKTLQSLVTRIRVLNKDANELVQYILQRKAELRKFFQDENSFYVCRISTGNTFRGEAPGALEVIPGPRPLANLDEIIGSNFGEVKHFIGYIERKAKWHDLYMATSPSRTTDKANVLLVGPQGCGKTEILRAVGSDTKSIGVFAQGSDFLTCWLGEAQKNPKRLFEAGLKLQKESKKHVHFLIDEIDSVLNNDRMLSSSATNLTLEFQILMDGVVHYPNLSVWGTTNNPARIPMPMIRRFSKVLIVGELSQEDRITLLKHFIAGFLPIKGIEKKHWERFSNLLDGATGDIIRKVADHVWRKSVSEFIDKQPGYADAAMKSLSAAERFEVANFKSDARGKFIEALGKHFAVTPDDIEESITLHLNNIAIHNEIQTAKETYKAAHEFMAQIKS